jgi:tetratricopeptide (TPR) repeat protein
MFKQMKIPFLKLLVISLLLTLSTAFAIRPIAAQSIHTSASLVSNERFTGRGLRITQVYPASPAARAGLKPMDLIFRYGEFEIVDSASYFTARDAYEKSPKATIQIMVWRDGKPSKITVESGWLGIDSDEYSPLYSEFTSLMDSVNAMREIPEYMREREFKDTFTPDKSPQKIIEQAQAVIDRGEQNGTLTPAQILVARIYMIFDDASREEIQKQSELLQQLIASQPPSFIHVLGNDLFFEKKRFRAAIECFKQHLKLHPDDVSIRLNLGLAYNRVSMFAEANTAADYALADEARLSQRNQYLAYNVKAMAALGRQDYSKAIEFGEKAFETEDCHCDLSLVMLAAAETGDLAKFQETLRKALERLPEEFSKRKLQLAAVEAFALVKAGKRDQAIELVRKWQDTDRIEGRLKAYWKIYPGGSDVWTNWTDLTRH